MNILLIGDVIGRPGRTIVSRVLSKLRSDKNIDLVIANCENSAGGFGVTPSVAEDLFSAGVDALTSGNHIWRKREGVELLKTDKRILRPANYPDEAPGTGSTVIETKSGHKVGILNLQGQVFMSPIDSPFKVAEKELARLKLITPIIIVDMHAEATSEKVAMGWFLDGKISCFFGTHTHIPTADEHILPKGTGYITDVGMTGPYDSVIGRDKDDILKRFLTGMPVPSDMAEGDVQFHSLLVEVEPSSGKAKTVERIKILAE